MKTKTVFVTFDNKEHVTAALARRHIDVAFSDKLCMLAQDAVNVTEYQAMKVFLHDNLYNFIALKAMLDDMALVSDEDSED